MQNSYYAQKKSMLGRHAHERIALAVAESDREAAKRPRRDRQR